MITNELERLGLAGRPVVRELRVGAGESYLVLVTDDGEIQWDTDADCCSETWFADVVGVENLLGQPVLAATETQDTVRYDELAGEEPDKPWESRDPRNRTRQEYDQIYGVTLTTPAGECDIIYRNSSNGYYGGSIYNATGPEYRDVGWYVRSSDRVPDSETRIVGDWHAPTPKRWWEDDERS